MFKSQVFRRPSRIALGAITIAAITIAVIAVAALSLLTPSDVLAKKNTVKARAHAHGAITAIDTNANTVTLQDVKTNQPVTVTVDSSTRIRRDGKKATLAELVVGDQARTKYNKQTLLAKWIRAKSPKIKGSITAIDTTAHTVSIQSGQDTPVTLTVTDTTKIRRNHQKATLSDLVVGDSAKAKYDPQTLQASKLRATSQ